MIHNSQERPDSKTLKRDIGVSQSVNALHKTEELDAKDIKDLRIKYNSVIGDSHSRRGSLQREEPPASSRNKGLRHTFEDTSSINHQRIHGVIGVSRMSSDHGGEPEVLVQKD